MSLFKPATRTKTQARVLLAGPGGSGKTRAALEIARGLGDRIAVIDTENRSASLYVGLNGLQFQVAELSPPFTYDKYLAAIREAVTSRMFDVLVIDSLTHAWAGEGGALEQIDKVKQRNGNAFVAWGDITPDHNKLLSAITGSPIHLIGTVRTKNAYVMEEAKNRRGETIQKPRKVGLAPVQREGLEYEFSVAADIDTDHVVTISKTRIPELDRARFEPDQLEEIGRILRTFHETGEVPKPQAAPPSPPPSVNGQRQRELADAVAGKEPVFSKGFTEQAEYADWKGKQLSTATAAVLFDYALYLDQRAADKTQKKVVIDSINDARDKAGAAFRTAIVAAAQAGNVAIAELCDAVSNHVAAGEDLLDAAATASRELERVLEAEAAEAALSNDTTDNTQQELGA